MNKTPSKVAAKNLKQPAEIVTASTDPNFYSNLDMLPNPDPILRKLGKDTEAYKGILYDSHVMGVMKALRSGLLKPKRRIVAGGEDSASIKAHAEIMKRMGKRPAPGVRWDDFLWNIYRSVHFGQSVHEIGWEYDSQYLLPRLIKDRPSRRFQYTIDNQARIITKTQPMRGEEAPDHRRLLFCRHMPSEDNPYGVATLSACYWPWVFKHNGWKWLVKLCEKYGFPLPVGRFPTGTPKADQDKFARDLADMLEVGAFAIEEGNSIELVDAQTVTGGNGGPLQERIINLANTEMSKALTSVTLSTETQGAGSRAAVESHRDKEQDISETDRAMTYDTVNQLFAWMTELNWPDANPPILEDYTDSDPTENWLKVIDTARKFMPVSSKDAYARLQLTKPEDNDELISGLTTETDAATGGDAKPKPPEFSAYRDTGDIAPAVDPSSGMAVDTIIGPIRAALDSAKTLTEFQEKLIELYPDLDDSTIANYLELAFQQNYLEGREE